jgi:cysteine synthase
MVLADSTVTARGGNAGIGLAFAAAIGGYRLMRMCLPPSHRDVRAPLAR